MSTRKRGLAAETEVYAHLRGTSTALGAWASSFWRAPRAQVPTRCRYRELHFRGVADIVDAGVWELKHSDLPLRALTLLSYPQLCIYAWALSVPIAGLLNLRTREVQHIHHRVTIAEMEAIRDIFRYRD